jgi:Mn-dependent DtxR family transcriptional regulator
MLTRLAIRQLAWTGAIRATNGRFALTDAGRKRAKELVRSYRLWESYMAKHFELPDDHLHESAARVKHYIDPALHARLSDELKEPGQDPHGKSIPAEQPEKPEE